MMDRMGMLFDYVLYLLCRRRGIATAMFEFPSPLPRLLMIQEDFARGIDGLAESYAAKLAAHPGGEVSLSPAVEEALAKVRETYDQGKPWYMKMHAGRLGQIGAARSWKSRVSQVEAPSHALAAARRAGHFLLDPPPPNYTKMPGHPVGRAPTVGISWRMDRLRRGRLNRQAGNYYGQLARRVDLGQPYVLAALHFQPERTTSPMGGRYVDQLLMLRLLSRWLPAGWRLYVKEAPAIFFPHITKQPMRSPEFYDQIAALPNAELVDMAHDTYEMVDQCRAVAMVTGTIGWEAVLRGKPALTFGHPWYIGCEGVLDCAREEDLRQALAAVAAGRAPRADLARLFMQALEELSLGAFIDERFRAAAGVDDAENQARLAQALDALVRRQLG